MVEHALREGTAGSDGTESLGETEGFSDGQVGLKLDERSSRDGLFSDNNTSSGGEALVNTTNGIIGALDFDEEDRLLEAGLSGELASVEDSSGSGDELSATSVDSIGVEGNILKVEADSSHVLLSHNTFFGGPLEGSFDGVLNFVHVLDGLGVINNKVRSGGVGSEAPNLLGFIGVPFVFGLEHLVAELGVLLGSDLVFLNSLGEIVTERAGLGEDSVMLVGGFGEALLAGLFSDSFLVGDDGVSLLDLALCELFFEILKADFDMELSATGDNVFTGLFSVALN